MKPNPLVELTAEWLRNAPEGESKFIVRSLMRELALLDHHYGVCKGQKEKMYTQVKKMKRVMTYEQDIPASLKTDDLMKAVRDGLWDAIQTHGPIDSKLISSVQKRVMGCVLQTRQNKVAL